ncbi:MAG TPA: hypothetical protein VMT34_07085 [Aggregatilineales bacterium]|nr:hypothetical protein [Aggregatilineales bacterium]
MKKLGLCIVVLALALSVVGLPSSVAQADNTNHATHASSWADVSPVARYRSPADWLVDIGRFTKQQAYGPFKSKAYQVNDTERFIALDYGAATRQPRTLTAKLRLVSDHAYWWFEDGTDPDPVELQKAGDHFEKAIIPLDTKLFGDYWSPGIDGDPRIFILHQKTVGSQAVGVFSPKDECPKTVCPTSNQHEMLYYGMDYGLVNSPQHLTVIAHELQHLIQYNMDGNQQRWLNEGLSQLAEHLNGFNPRNIADINLRAFLQAPNLQLDSWPDNTSTDPSNNYAVSYIFCVYLYQRFGTALVQHIAHSHYKGLASIEEALKALNTGVTLDQVFTDWALTNYVDNPYVGDGRYYYQSLKLPTRALPHDLSAGMDQRSALNEYGSEYWQISAPGTYTLNFKADTSIKLIGDRPASGSWFWWSYNEPQGAARLERDFDLSKVASPVELQFSAWWSLSHFAFAQLLISSDGGKTWDFLKATDTQNCNQMGLTFNCFTAKSNGWQREQVDLSPYAGKKVRLRFEYLTEGVASPGFFVDDIAIPAIHFADDVESLDTDWQSQGFVRVTAALPQHWAVNVVMRDEPATLVPVTLDDNNTAQVQITVPDGGAVVVVGAMAPFVQAAANYSLALR